jgi:rubrerythrin
MDFPSRAWRDHFFESLRQEPDLPWHLQPSLTPEQRDTIGPSVQQFQLGENSSGLTLLAMAARHAARLQDPYLVEAFALFIHEEQRHSQMLGRFLRGEGLPELGHHWLDQVFRRLRRAAGLELMLAALSAAEILAIPYYRALGQATGSALLRKICRRILADEAMHLRFQAQNLATLGPRGWRAPAARWMRALLLAGTVLVVWREHRKVFSAGGMALGDVWRIAFAQLRAMEGQAREAAQDRRTADYAGETGAAETGAGETGASAATAELGMSAASRLISSCRTDSGAGAPRRTVPTSPNSATTSVQMSSAGLAGRE